MKQLHDLNGQLVLIDWVGEEWKPIKNYEGLYEVSNMGKIRTCDRFISYINGEPHFMKSIILKTDTSDRYARVRLYKNTKHKNFSVHRLVARHFVANPDNKPCVNHIDGDKNNNKAENLEWCTSKENAIHSWRLGLSKTTDKSRCNIIRGALISHERRRRNVKCNESEVVYGSITEAAAALDMNNDSLSYYLRKGCFTHPTNGLTYKYA